MNIHEILKNSKDFQDDLTATITGPDGNAIEIPLRDLRQKFRASDADYTRKSQELAEQGRLFENQKLEWARMQTARPDEPVVQKTSSNEELDELFRPVFERIYGKYDPAMKQVEELQTELKRREADQLQTMTIYADREIRKMYRDLPEKPTKDDGTPMDAKEFARYAVGRGYVDSQGFPDFERASDDYFGPTRVEKKIKEAREMGKKEAMEEVQRISFMPKPGLGRPFHESGEKAPQKNVQQEAGGINRATHSPQRGNKSRAVFSEALSEALNDSSIREGLFNLNRG